MQRDGSLFWLAAGKLSPPGTLVRCVESIPGAQRERFATLFHALLERGIYLAPSGFEVGFLSCSTPTRISISSLSAFEAALAARSALRKA